MDEKVIKSAESSRKRILHLNDLLPLLMEAITALEGVRVKRNPFFAVMLQLCSSGLQSASSEGRRAVSRDIWLLPQLACQGGIVYLSYSPPRDTGPTLSVWPPLCPSSGQRGGG